MKQAAQMQHPDAMRVLYAAMSKANDARSAARGRMDDLMRATVDAYRNAKSGGGGSADWAKYFLEKANGELALTAERSQIFSESQEHLRRLRNGEMLDDILGKSTQQLSIEAMKKAAKIDMPVVPQGFEPGSVMNAAEDAQFKKMLEASRGQVKAAESEAWRIAFALDPQYHGEALDLIMSADLDTAQMGQIAAAKVRAARERWYEEAASASRSGGADFWETFGG
jgi:hypothetical protein